jgi:hypothetical protein
VSSPRTALAASLLALAASSLAAQSPPDSADAASPEGRCRGERVSAIDIRPGRPPFAGAVKWWRAAARAIGLHHVTTRPSTVASFLDVAVGEPCTEFRRSESERVLRAQPFLADATVRAEPDTGGTIRIIVTTVDEVPALVSGRLSGGVPAALSLGNANAFGLGISVEGGVERGFAYRPGYDLQLTDYAFLGRALEATLDVERAPVGGHVAGELSRPFLTDLQRTTWHLGARSDHDYLAIVRPARDGLTIGVREHAWDMSAARRLRTDGWIALVGGAITSTVIEPEAQGVRVTSDGFRPDSDGALAGRWSPFRATRVLAIGGLRHVRYESVRGFDALTASQDVPVGAELVTLAGPGVGANRDLFVSSTFYAGAARPSWRLALQATSEARRPMHAAEWDGIISSARAAWYVKEGSRGTFIASQELSDATRSISPLQLTLGGRDGGVRGYANAAFAGATRLVGRVEQRFVLGSPRQRGDLGMAVFADVGTMWAGEAPYGTDVTRASAGVSLLGAFPMHAKRLYRVDLAIPLATREARGGGSALEIRLSSDDLTRRFWREPGDVAAARIGAVPTSVMAWPAR